MLFSSLVRAIYSAGPAAYVPCITLSSAVVVSLRLHSQSVFVIVNDIDS